MRHTMVILIICIISRFKTALIYLCHLKALDETLNPGKDSRIKLLSLWSEIGTEGRNALYEQLFLSPSVLKSSPVFDHPLGHYLEYYDVATDQYRPFYWEPNNVEEPKNGNVSLKSYALTVQGALGLTFNEINVIVEDNSMTLDSAELSMATMSLLYRYGLLSRALNLSVSELISLKQLSGINPFKSLYADPLTHIDQDYPYADTLRFVEIADQVSTSGFDTLDLDYLLRHHFDPLGEFQVNQITIQTLLKTLGEGIRTIRSEHALPDNPDILTNELLSQNLGLILPADVVERFLSMINQTAEFTAIVSGVASVDQLLPDAFSDTHAIREISYDEIRQEQKLTYRGVLLEQEKLDLQADFPSPLFAKLLEDIHQQARAFYRKYFQKQSEGYQPTAGFLEEDDYELVFKISVDEQEDTIKRNLLAKAFLPYLQERLIHQFIVEMMIEHTEADPEIVESLLTDIDLISTTDSNPLLGVFSGIGQQGVNAEFYDSDDLSGTAQNVTSIVTNADMSLKPSLDIDDNQLNPANSAHFAGYFQVNTPGAYRIFIVLEKTGSQAKLKFDHLPDPVFLAGSASNDNSTLGEQPQEIVELKPGRLYQFDLELTNLNGSGARVLIQGETVPKDKLSQLVLYPEKTMIAVNTAVVLLTKVLLLVQKLDLNLQEIKYFTSHAADFNDLNISGFPTRRNEKSSAQVHALFNQFLRLTAYSKLKHELKSDTGLIDIFDANHVNDLNAVYANISTLTRHPETTIKSTAELLFSTQEFSNEKPLHHLWDTLKIVQRFGVSETDLKAWSSIVSRTTSPKQRFEIARNLKETIKARLEPESWRGVAQPIFDTLRQQQRDALSDHVIHKLNLQRIEQLYEYFLIDPGMEPVVQTSRIRLAIASVQLFIQRCLLNLEPQVNPSAIKSSQWEWKKRYRVWEANRKIFMFPENWCEPEFRNDKTFQFTELESALLQSDVSSDLVEDAFFNYIKKLDELAHLDIVAMHIEDDPDPSGRTLHVFGRTYSNPYHYFYRRYAHQMWSPWEPVNADIQGNHLAPVVWRDRLYLFWVTFLDKPQDSTKASEILPSDKLSSMTLKNAYDGLTTAVNFKNIELQLHWSEYNNNKWSSPESSEYQNADVKVSKKFNLNTVDVYVSKQTKDKNGYDRGVYIHLRGGGSNNDYLAKDFYLGGRNSQPKLRSGTGFLYSPYGSVGHFFVGFNHKITTEIGKASQSVVCIQQIFNKLSNGRILTCNNELTTLGAPLLSTDDVDNPDAVNQILADGMSEIAGLIKPLFYFDKENTLFVEPDVRETTVEEWQEWVSKTPLSVVSASVGLVDQLQIASRFPGNFIQNDQLQFEDRSLLNLKANQDWMANPGTLLEYEGELIGPTGQAGLAHYQADDLKDETKDITTLQTHPGSAMQSIILTDPYVFEKNGLNQSETGFNIIGGSGINLALKQNLNEMKDRGFDITQ